MHKAGKALWDFLRDGVANWILGGLILAATGAVPEEWLARAARGLNVSEGSLHLWAAGIDVRVVPISGGFIIIGVALWHRSQARVASPPSSDSPSRPLSVSLESSSAGSINQSTTKNDLKAATERQRGRSRTKPVGDLLEQIRPDVIDAASIVPFTVLLCGPTLGDLTKPSADLCRRIKQALEARQFNVVLGEDDGLRGAQFQRKLNPQDGELEFARDTCSAIVLVADSAGTFCELGTFSWHYANDKGALNRTRNRLDCILLMDVALKGNESYLTKGPGAKLRATGLVEYVDFAAYDPAPILDRLQERRALVAGPKRRPARRRS